jgi:hypothetical protein
MRIPVALATLALAAAVGCGAKPKSLENEWKDKTRQDCRALAELLDELSGDLDRVQHAFGTERARTGPKLAFYNPGLFGRLGRLAERLDLTVPRRAERLRRAAWMTHYRFVPGAAKLLPRLHRFVALLHQLKASLDLGRSQEQKFGKDLAERKPGWIPLGKRTHPMFGVVIKDHETAAFTGALGEPVRRSREGTCERAEVKEAEGYRLGDGNCYFFTRPPEKKGDCPQVHGTLRCFDNQDPELIEALRCLSMADVLMEGFRFRVLDLELILGALTRLNPGALARQFRTMGQR